MISLIMVVNAIALLLVLAVGAATLSARALGSPRATFRVGLTAVVLLWVINIGVFALGSAIPGLSRPTPGPVILTAVFVQAAFILFVFSRAFRLSFKRAFGPLVAYLVANAVWYGCMAFLVRPLIAEPFMISGRSMTPTVTPGDRIFVEKLLPPSRWDLVAYHEIRSPQPGGPQPVVMCKRLIALPGERLRFENGQIYINDHLVEAPSTIAGRCHSAPAGMSPEQKRYKDGESIILGPDEYFFIGDNLDISNDSRLEGPSIRSSLIGVIDLVYWPPSHARIGR